MLPANANQQFLVTTQLASVAAAVKQAAHTEDCQELKGIETELKQLWRTGTQNLGI